MSNEEHEHPRPHMVYIAGPMTGIPDLNEPAFLATRSVLQQSGYTVIDPIFINMSFMGQPHPKDEPTKNAPGLRADLLALTLVDGICLLPGWEKSRGARLEVAIAITFRLAFVHWQTGEVVARPRHVVVTHGYGEEEDQRPGTIHDWERAILQLTEIGLKQFPQATSLSHLVGLLIQRGDRDIMSRTIIKKLWASIETHIAIELSPQENEFISRVMEDYRT
jgi:hypothetical protein